MPAVTPRQLRELKPFLQGERANIDGEWGMHCPFHDDRTRSASVNVKNGVWFCQVCRTGGPIPDLIERMKWESTNGHKPHTTAEFVDFDSISGEEYLTEDSVYKLHRSLGRNKDALAALRKARGLSVDTLKRYQIGWDDANAAYTIPVRSRQGEILNVRFYKLDPGPNRRKIWGVTGHNEPVLYPIAAMEDASEVVLCEGEWDALITIQNGFPAVTRTAAAAVWHNKWNHSFLDKVVYICQDCDDAGVSGGRKIAVALQRDAREIRLVELPYPLSQKHGKDLTDYFHVDKHTPHDFKDLISATPGRTRDPELTAKQLIDVGILDSFNSDRAGDRMRMNVTVSGKRSAIHQLPKEIEYSCTQSAGAKCQICPMNDMEGRAVRTIPADDRMILDMIGSPDSKMHEIMRTLINAQKCGLLDTVVREFRSVEELYVRASIDQPMAEGHQHTNRRVISVGRHDTLPNNTVEVVGTIYPSPKDQHNEFQAWDVSPTKTSLDLYQSSRPNGSILERFRPEPGQSPLGKAAEISKELSNHITKIVNRPEMHVLMDLVYHSVLSFRFDNTLITKGWLEALIVGDTRTGKSEAAERLSHHYGLGEIVSCESATFAGIVGGLQQLGQGREWEITWGTIPLNDRRLVVLDEISGLSKDQIAQMSSIRSSGLAQLTKIRSESTLARTRLLWMGNPRNARMANYTYGVQAIRPLIGNNEDIARFDLAMAVKTDEVDSEAINASRADVPERRYNSEACHELLLWAWSRVSDQVVWGPGAVDAVHASALALGGRYTEDPPLIQAANVRFKIARLAVALAARTYSTDRSGECVVVRKTHVVDAIRFIDRIYGLHSFGYRKVSEEYFEDLAIANKARDDTRSYLTGQVGLARFLRNMEGSFRMMDMMDMLNMSRESANLVVKNLWTSRMINRDGPNIKISPVLHEILRDVKE